MATWKILAAAALAPLALAACATPGAGPASQADQEKASPYGLFLAGQAALDKGDSADAAQLFARAAHEDQVSSLPAEQAFAAALLAGDISRAAALAPSGATVDPAIRRLGALTRAVEAMAEGRGKEARALLTSPDVGAPHNAAAALLAPFAAAEAGDAEASIARPVIPGEALADFFANLDQGRLFERAGRFDEAETAFRALVGVGDAGGLPSLELGELLERRGRSEQAVQAYKEALARNPEDGALRAALARATVKGKPPAPQSLRQDAAEALIAQATALLMRKQDEGGLAYLRLALRLDPARAEGWTMVGDILSSMGDLDGARSAYRAPTPKSDEFVQARGKLAWTYQNAGDKTLALKIAREAVSSAPSSRDAQVTLADLLRADGQYEEAIRTLDTLIAADGGKSDWRLLYLRAVAYEESGRWAESEADLSAALKRKPDEPELLNFLGYSWIDRGVRLREALAMVQKAVDQNPQSGAMLDSLGWGYFRLGDYSTAVAKLEAAVALDASDPDVNNHLGDAYWRVGRRNEARFQWTRVLSLDPPAKLRTEVEEKLKSGPSSVAPSVVAEP